jgi:S1-C subfamily serine protease
MALAQAETDAASKQQEIEMAEQQRLALERAEEQARLLAEQRANETAAREAEAEAAESNEQGFLGQMLAVFTGGDEQTAGSQAGQDEQREKAQATTVVETDSTDAVVLNEQPETQESFDNSIQQAPKEAVVVLQAPQRPAPRTFTAPAPVRTQPATAKETGNNLVSRDLYAEVASAIVSISTRNEPNASGFILDDKGHIVTAWNVINGVTEADVRFMGISGSARTYKARVIKHNKFHDLALLQLINPPEGIQPITVGPDSLPDAGAKVRVFGQKNGEIWATDDAVVTRISPHFTWFSKNNVIHRGEVLQVDLPQEGREVGSLVTSMDYQMLGMKSFTGSQTGRTYAVTVRMIKDFVTSK